MTPDQWFDLAQTVSDIVSPVLAALAAEILRANVEARRESRKKKPDQDDEPEAGQK